MAIFGEIWPNGKLVFNYRREVPKYENIGTKEIKPTQKFSMYEKILFSHKDI